MSSCRSASRAVACAATLVLLACHGTAGDEARVSVRYYDAALLPRQSLTVTVDDGTQSRTFNGADLGGGGPVRELATSMQGTLRVAFRFDLASTVASQGAVEVPLRPDWSYGFDIMVDSLNPARLCFGCMGSRPFPLAAAYRRTVKDSVWVVWGGNSIRNPVIY